jgi:murein endopeptidase
VLVCSAALLGAACSPTFFAREASFIPPAAPVLEDEALTTGPGETNGLGCSPKGCMPAPASFASFVVSDGGPLERSGRIQSTRAAALLANHPLRGKSSQDIARMVKAELPSLGAMSFGIPTRGGLLNATYMPEDPRWTLVDPAHAWGTAETVGYLVTALEAVFREFPVSHAAFIGDISRQRGGYLKPHLSHQAGKDVDLGYFYTTKDPVWYTRATAYNLDRPRTWAFIRSLIALTDVHLIFIDRRVQRLLRSYAESIGEDPGWLHSIFDGNQTEESMIRHEPGHETHFHVRFYNPLAEETARRCYSALLEQKKLLPMRYNITHTVKKGETLIGLAKRYGMTPGAIMRANAMTKSSIIANKKYFIPQNGPAAPSEPTLVPPRRVPPPRAASGPIASLSE